METTPMKQTVVIATKSAMDLVRQAKGEIENLTPEEANEERLTGTVVMVDVREADELQQGYIPGAINAPRGMIEFYADPSLPYYKPEFTKDRRLILYCASGGRSALTVQTLEEMGYNNVSHIDGGFKAWQAASLPVSK